MSLRLRLSAGRSPLGLLSLVALWGSCLRVEANPARFQQIKLGDDVRALHWGRRGEDARLDLFVLGSTHVRIWEQGDAGFPSDPNVEVPLPQETSLVDFGDVGGSAGEEVVLLSRRGVHADLATAPPADREAGAQGLPGYSRILAVAGITVGLDTAPATFLRDLDGDGKVDLVVPTRGGYELFRRAGDHFDRVISLEGAHRVKVDTGGPGLLDPLELELSVPQVKLKDLNGDGKLDLLSRVGEKTRCYLQGAAGFNAEPTYELDLAKFREGEASSEPGKKSGSRRPGLSLGGAIKVHETDVDGDGVQDYLIAAGQYLRVYFGAREGTDFSRPHTMLKLSSELQGVGSFDVDNDKRLDLVALKFELPSLPRLVAAYFLSMTLDFEVLGYRNEGGRKFSRRPDWRNTLSLALPPLRQVIEGFDSFADQFLEKALGRGRYASGDVNGDGLPDAAFVDRDDVVRVFFARPGTRSPGKVQLGSILFDAKKNRWELEELLGFVANANYEAARKSVEGRTADLELPLGATLAKDKEVKLQILDLNGDGRGELVVDGGAGTLHVGL